MVDRTSSLLPEVPDDIVTQRVDEGLLLLRPDGRYIVLNRTAMCLWEALPTANSPADLGMTLSQLPGSPDEEQCRIQANRWLEHMVREGFLRWRK